MPFLEDGFQVFRNVLSEDSLVLLRRAVFRTCKRFREGDEDCLASSVSLADYTERRPERNPSVNVEALASEPYILGNLAGLDADFRSFLYQEVLWLLASKLLDVSESEVVYHSAQIVRKPALVGPGLSWHRDYANTYVSTVGPLFVRLLIPLEGMNSSNGGTGIVPSSHQISDEEAARREGTEESGEGAVYPDVQAGDILAIHSKLIHGGGPNRSDVDRQLLTVQFGASNAAMLYTAERHESLTLCRRDQMMTLSSKQDVASSNCVPGFNS